MNWSKRLFLNKYREAWIKMDITSWIPYFRDIEFSKNNMNLLLSEDPNFKKFKQTELKKFKRILKPYAKRLGWKIVTGTSIHTIDATRVGGEKITTVSVSLYPKEMFVSPKTFLDNKEKILSVLFILHRNFVHEKDMEENLFRRISIECIGDEKVRENYAVFESLYFQDDPFSTSLNYHYKLVDRIEFEKESKELALKLFGKTVEEDINSIFKKTIEYGFEENSQKMKENISELFEIRID